MRNVDLQELSLEEMKEIEGGFILEALLGLAIGFIIGFIGTVDTENISS